MLWLHLLERKLSRGITITSAGGNILSRAKRLIYEFDGFLKSSVDLQESLRGFLQIGYFAPIASAILPEVIRPLMQGEGKVTIKFIEGDNQQAQDRLLRGEIDVAIFMDYSVHPEIKTVKLMEIPVYLLMPENHPLSLKKTISFADLHDQKMIFLDLPMTFDYYQTIFTSAGIKLNIVATASSTEMIRSLVAEGYGLSLLNMRPQSDMTYAGKKVICRPVSDSSKNLNMVLGLLETTPSRLVSEFSKLLIEYAHSKASEKLRVVV